MNYGELKHNLISKGFAEEADYEEFEELGYTFDAINQAVNEIADHFPCEAEFDFEIDESDTGILKVDMNDRKGFLALAETPIWYENNGEEIWRAFTEYDVKKNRELHIKADDYEGSFRIYYFKLPTQITKDTPDEFELELPLGAHKLVPLLASYYLWLDDDERKAMMYKNDYMDALAVALQKLNQARAKVIPSEWGDI